MNKVLDSEENVNPSEPSVSPLGPQQPPDHQIIYNRRRLDGNYPPLWNFFREAEKPCG